MQVKDRAGGCWSKEQHEQQGWLCSHVPLGVALSTGSCGAGGTASAAQPAAVSAAAAAVSPLPQPGPAAKGPLDTPCAFTGENFFESQGACQSSGVPRQAAWSSGGCGPDQAPATASCSPEPSSGLPVCTGTGVSHLSVSCIRLHDSDIPSLLRSQFDEDSCRPAHSPDAVCFLSAEPQASMNVPACHCVVTVYLSMLRNTAQMHAPVPA